MDTTFDPRVEVAGINLFKGEFTNITLRQDPPLPHHVSNRAIDPGREFFIDMNWQVTGSEVPLRMNAVGNWSVYAYAESVGPGPEISLGSPSTVTRGPVAADIMTWSTSYRIAPGTLPEHIPGGASGVFKICVVVFANSTLPGPGNDVIGFGEVPVILSERPA